MHSAGIYDCTAIGKNVTKLLNHMKIKEAPICLNMFVICKDFLIVDFYWYSQVVFSVIVTVILT